MHDFIRYFYEAIRWMMMMMMMMTPYSYQLPFAMLPLHKTSATRILSAVYSDRNDMLARPA